MQIVVLDGMGGGIGFSVIEKMREKIPQGYIIAAGTNAVALNRMLNAGANEGVTGEKSLICTIEKADIIVGAIGVLIPNGLGGEISPGVVMAIYASKAVKVLIPMDKCGLKIATDKMPISYYINHAIEIVNEHLTSR